MPHFVVLCADKPNSLDLRLKTRDEHLAYLEQTGVVRMAGPFLDADDKPCGSMLLVETADLAAAKDFAAGDPYAKAGLFESTDVRPYRLTIAKL